MQVNHRASHLILSKVEEDHIAIQGRANISRFEFQLKTKSVKWKEIESHCAFPGPEVTIRGATLPCFGPSKQRYCLQSSIQLSNTTLVEMKGVLSSNQYLNYIRYFLELNGPDVVATELYKSTTSNKKEENVTIKRISYAPHLPFSSQREDYLFVDYSCDMTDDWSEGALGEPYFVKVFMPITKCLLSSDLNIQQPTLFEPIGLVLREGNGIVTVQCIASCIEPLGSSSTFMRSSRSRIKRMARMVHYLPLMILGESSISLTKKELLCCNSCAIKFSWRKTRHVCGLCTGGMCTACTFYIPVSKSGQLKGTRCCSTCLQKNSSSKTKKLQVNFTCDLADGKENILITG